MKYAFETLRALGYSQEQDDARWAAIASPAEQTAMIAAVHDFRMCRLLEMRLWWQVPYHALEIARIARATLASR